MGEYINVVETFGCEVFNDSVMQARLPKKIYKELKKTITATGSSPLQV